MSESSPLASPQNPKLRHPHPVPGSLSISGAKTDNNIHTYHHRYDQAFSPSKSVPSGTTTGSIGLESPFVVTVRSSPNGLRKSNSSTISGPPPPPERQQSKTFMISSSTSNKTGPRLALYRSNSSLDLLDRDSYLLRLGRNVPYHAHKTEHQTTQGCFTRRKDFGSHGSIDVLSSSVAVVSCTATGCKQPALSLSMASTNRKGSADDGQHLKNPADVLVIKETASPRLRLKFQKLFEPRDKGNDVQSPSKPESSSSTSIFRKLRGGRDSGTIPAPASVSEISHEPEIKPVLRHNQVLGTEERIRRRVFAHYDCQSVSANISYAAKLRGMLSKRRNTTTGASAASLGNRLSTTTTPSSSLNNIGAVCAAENSCLESSQEGDMGDGRENSLVLSCPYFRNEIGGEEEHIISFTKFNRVIKHSESSTHNDGGQSVVQRRAVGRDETHRAHSARSLSILEWSAGRSHWTQGTCLYKGQRSTSSPLEAVDLGAEYYRTYFYKQEHENWLGSDELLGPLAISIKREKLENDKKDGPGRYFYRLIARSTELNTLRGSILEDGIKVNPKDRGIHSKEVIEFILPEIQLQCLRLAQAGSATEEQLLKVDQQILTHRHKIGIMYCRNGQATEEEMYNNEDAGPAFNEFLDIIGQRVRLKGFDKYTGGLDNKDDSTGLYSIYSAFQDCEVIFHVSTLLPFTPNNRQQLMRKRHIGNDIVTIVFQEPGSQPFTPKNIRSQFQHVFIVVQAINPCSENTYYGVSVSRSKEVPLFGPPIPEGARFPKGKAFVDFLLSKAINAENATYRSEKFTTMATRTRQEYLKDLVASFSTNIQLDPRSKFSMLQFGHKKKEQSKPKYTPDAVLRGALSWSVWLQDSWNDTRLDTYLGISADTFVFIDALTREPIFALPTTSILGWNSGTDNCLRIFYHQGECVTIEAKEVGYGAHEVDDLREIVQRLEAITQGCETEDFILRRNEIGQLGFHVQQDGVITEVESCGYAAKAGLKQGSRLVEICKLVVATLSQDEMIDCLKNLTDIVVTIVPPLPDGNIRRGCDARHCIYTADPETEYYENTYTALNCSVNDFESHPSTYQQPFVFNSKNLLRQAVPGNHRKRYEPRSFSPPRSSNSSGYGTGSSSKSFSSDPHSLSYQEGEITKYSNGNYQCYDFLNEKPLRTDGNNSPPPIPARNIHNKIRSNRQTHPAANGRVWVEANQNGSRNSVGITNSGPIGNEFFSSPYLDKSFSAKREFFQRNGSFQGKLPLGRNNELPLQHSLGSQSRVPRSVQPVKNGHGDYELLTSPIKAQIDCKKNIPGGPIYQLSKNITAPVIETTLKGKVTYLTDFPLKQVPSLEHLTSNGTIDQKDVDTARNERLAALKSAYLEKNRSAETNKTSRFSSPTMREISNPGNVLEELTPALVKLRGTSSSVSSRTSSNSTASSPKSGEVKLRVSNTTSSRGSSGIISDRTNRNSTLQEDLMRLIDPDYLQEFPLNNPPSSLQSSVSPARNMSPENSRFSTPPHLVLLTDAQNWSTPTASGSISKPLIHFDQGAESNSSISYTPSSKNQQRISSEEQISPCSSSLSPSIESHLSLQVAHSPSPSWRDPQNGMESKNIKNGLENFLFHPDNVLPESVFNLESRVSQLETELRKEQESKQVLATKVENLQHENRRLLEENHITQDQFNKILQTLDAAKKPS